MKKIRIIVTLLMILLIGGGWSSGILGLFGKSRLVEMNEYEQYMNIASDYMDRGLYQLAIQQYEKALSIDNSLSLQNAILDAYQLRADETGDISDEYINAAIFASQSFPTDEDLAYRMASLLMGENDYYKAYKQIMRLMDSGLTSEKINSLFNEIRYSYTLSSHAYTNVRGLTNKLYAVEKGGQWGFLQSNGDVYSECHLENAYSCGEKMFRLQYDGKKTRMLDDNDVVQGIFNMVPEKAGVYSEGLIPICVNGKYGFYNSLGDYQFGEFDYAGAFQKGIAAVKNGDDWFLIDKNGNPVSGQTYRDIKLNQEGKCFVDDLFLADRGDGYNLYDKEENLSCQMNLEETDIFTKDKIIAFKKDGKWGFINTEGEILLEPKYAMAKSYSKGVAAVCIDGKWGYINKDGDIVIDTQFNAADYMNDAGGCFVLDAGGDWRFLKLRISF